MQTKHPYGGGLAPPSPDDGARAPVGETSFGVFPRFRSFGGADFPRGLPTRGARPIETVALREALSRRWDDDRHFVVYTASQPFRINNAALGTVTAEVRLLALDVDNHDDAPTWMEGERAKVAALLAAHPGGFVHTTRRGWRALFALASFPIRSEDDKERFALLYARIAAYVFEHFGIVADDALTRWNQPVRLPHVVRDGRAFDAEILAGEADSVGVFELPAGLSEIPDLRPLAAALPRWGGVAKRWQPSREGLRIVSAAFDHVPLPPYSERTAAAETWAREEAPRAVQRQGGRATARSVAATLRVGFALEREDVARILMGPYNRRRCSPPWSEAEIRDLADIAKAVAKTPIHAWGFMLSRDRTGIEVARATLAAAAEGRRVVSLEDVPARMTELLDQHRALVLRATYGAGKTYGGAEYIAKHTEGRVIVVIPTHELGRTWVEALASAGEEGVAYHVSVVQRADAKGVPHCDNRVALQLYKEGGDVARDVCPGCPRAATCPAYNAPPVADGRVHVLPREMLLKVGVTDEDLVVFDDSAVDLLEWHRLGLRELRRLGGVDARMLPSGQARFLPIFVDALLSGPRDAEERARAALEAAGLPSPLPGEALRYVAGRLIDGQRSPHVPRAAFHESEGELAETLRDVGRLRRVLRFATALAAGGTVHWSADALAIHGESPTATLLRTHVGRLVVLDASANVEELHALRTDLHIERMDVDDAGEVRRLLLFAKDATRTALREPKQRRDILDLWLPAVLAELTKRAAKRPVLIAYKGLISDLRAHPSLAAWCAEDSGRSVRFAHFGALRGSNRFRRRDAVVTLGDPWLNGDDVTGRARLLALDEPSYRIALATAELGQAHGRSRSVRRRAPLTLLHVGRLVPDGWGGGGVDVEPLGGPPERSRRAGDREAFAALVGSVGGNRVAGSLLGCSPSAVANWRSGARGLPRDALDRLRHAATATINPSASSGEAGRGAPSSEMDTVLCRKITRDCVHGGPRAALPAEDAVVHELDEGLGESVPLGSELVPDLRKINPLPRRGAPVSSVRREGSLARDGSRDPSAPGISFAVRGSESRLAGVEGDGAALAASALPCDVLCGFEDELALLAEVQAQVRLRWGKAGSDLAEALPVSSKRDALSGQNLPEPDQSLHELPEDDACPRLAQDARSPPFAGTGAVRALPPVHPRRGVDVALGTPLGPPRVIRGGDDERVPFKRAQSRGS